MRRERGREKNWKGGYDAVMPFLAGTLGFPAQTFEVGEGLGMYGLDSLNGVALQYWCWRGTFSFFSYRLDHESFSEGDLLTGEVI